MVIEGGNELLIRIVKRQLDQFFVLSRTEENILENILPISLERLKQNFSSSKNKYYRKNDMVYFNPYHSAQYCVFLYYLSNSVFLKYGRITLADKIYYLNKAMNSCDLFYEIQLPIHFTTDHPVGTVLGRAKYGEGFGFLQNCTVGNNKGIFPILGENVKLCANVIILGNCNIGNNVTVGAGALIKDQDVPANSYVFGHSPNLIIKPKIK